MRRDAHADRVAGVNARFRPRRMKVDIVVNGPPPPGYVSPGFRPPSAGMAPLLAQTERLAVRP